MIFPTPIYRFFSKEKYADDLVFDGKIRFTPTTAFAELSDERYRDGGEKYYHIKIVTQTKIKKGGREIVIGGDIHHTHRKIDDAWALCCTTSIVSSAYKPHAVYIKDIGLFQFELEKSIRKKFNEDLVLMFGPIAYYNIKLDSFSEVLVPPYFAKDEKFKSDLEFRFVIIPSKKIYKKGPIEPLDLVIENSNIIFGKTLLLHSSQIKE